MSVSSIKTKLILILSAILIPAFFATSVFNYHFARESIRQELLESSLPLTMDNIYSEIQQDLVRPIYISSLMASDIFLKDWVLSGERDLSQLQRYLIEIKKKYNFFSTFFVSSASKNYYYHDGILKKISPSDPHDIWYYAFLASGREYELDVDTNEAEDHALTIFINHRVEDDEGRTIGVAGVGLKMGAVAELIASYEKKYNRTIYFVNPDGDIEVHPNENLIGKASIFKLPGIGEAAVQILRNRSASTSLGYDVDDRHFLLTARYIPEFNWFLIVEQDEEESLEAIQANLRRNLIAGAAATLVVIAVCLFTVNLFQTRLEHMAGADPLTGAANRRKFENAYKGAVAPRGSSNGELCLILVDIDDFKEVNDNLGHISGDAVLKAVAEAVRGCIRKGDILARWGGDEFIVLTKNDAEQAKTAAERIRQAVADIAPLGDDAAVTVSCGLARRRPGDTLDALIRRADQAMYRAKRDGKNAVAEESTSA